MYGDQRANCCILLSLVIKNKLFKDSLCPAFQANCNLSLEVAAEGIRVNGVCPSLIYTVMYADGSEPERVAELGLVVYENYDEQEIQIARPASLQDPLFRGWTEDQLSAIGTTLLTINAPSAKITMRGKGRKAKFLVNISMTAAPGPGPEWFNEEFKDTQAVFEAIKECCFFDRIDSSKTSLEMWFDQR